jgi:hypothetical protein
MGSKETGVIQRYAWYENDVLEQAIRIFKRTGSVHNEILESALGIGKRLQDEKVSEAQMLGVQLRVVMASMSSSENIQPPDAGQLFIMLCSDDYPMDVREEITIRALGASSLQEFINQVEESIPGFRDLR